MPVTIQRKDIFMCSICGGLFATKEGADRCESLGILLPSCREGDWIGPNCDSDRDRKILAVMNVTSEKLGRSCFYFKVTTVHLIQIGFNNRMHMSTPSHEGTTLELIDGECKEGERKSWTSIIKPDKRPRVKVANWQDYLDEIKRINPSIAKDKVFIETSAEGIQEILLEEAKKYWDNIRRF